jgi:hypothetical protein
MDVQYNVRHNAPMPGMPQHSLLAFLLSKQTSMMMMMMMTMMIMQDNVHDLLKIQSDMQEKMCKKCIR